MRLEMICTGEEVLSGQIIDTNAAWFADTMMNHGIEMQRRLTVGDRLEDLSSAFAECSQRADLVLVNGGLGPTSDDLCAEAMAIALGEKLVEHPQWRDHLEAWFTKRKQVMPASNLKQCLLPASAILIDNPVGSAPGFRVKLNQAWFFFTPGVPLELKQMIKEQFIPFMQQTFNLNRVSKLHKLLTLGHGESTLADKLNRLPKQEGITIGYRASIPQLEIKLFARGSQAIAELPDLLTKIKPILGSALIAENTSSIAAAAHKLLISTNSSLSIAESCTGGMLSSQVVEFPGSSTYLQQSIVSYSNLAKQHSLNIPKSTIEQYGAVSMETAHAMAQGVRKLLHSDYALATTGIAGPDGGSEQKPVGTVVIALASKEKTWIQTLHLNNRSREQVRIITCAIALDMLRRLLLKEEQPIVDYPSFSRPDLKIILEPDH